MAELTQEELNWFQDQGWTFYERDEYGGRQLNAPQAWRVIYQDGKGRWQARTTRLNQGENYIGPKTDSATAALISVQVDNWGDL